MKNRKKIITLKRLKWISEYEKYSISNKKKKLDILGNRFNSAGKKDPEIEDVKIESKKRNEEQSIKYLKEYQGQSKSGVTVVPEG